MMDEQIPENRTKAYWDSKVANPYHNEKMIRRERLEGYVISLVLILLCLFIFWGRGIFHFSKLVQHLCVVLAIVAGLLVFFYTEYHCRKWIYCIRMDQKTGLVESSHVTFYEVIPQSDDYSSADSDPIRKLYPEDMVVCRYHLYYKVDGKKRYHGRRYYLGCIGSKQKFDEMSAFFFEKKKKKEGGLRSLLIGFGFLGGIYIPEPYPKSPIFKVTYTKYHKEFISLDFVEGESYPERCTQDKLERINIMF